MGSEAQRETADGPTPGSGEQPDETRVDWPTSPPPRILRRHRVRRRPRPPPTPPPPTAPAPQAASYGAPGTAGRLGSGAGAGPYAVPGMPALVFAGALHRFVAYVIDVILIGILGAVLFGLIVAITPA